MVSALDYVLGWLFSKQRKQFNAKEHNKSKGQKKVSLWTVFNVMCVLFCFFAVFEEESHSLNA